MTIAAPHAGTVAFSARLPLGGRTAITNAAALRRERRT